jgi:DNA-binding NarL/FixJ family response regulator
MSRVLVVDDDMRFRLGISVLLSRAGVEVVGEATDGAEALEVARRETPDVVLLDLLMPRMDGFAALPALRELLPDANIIVLTNLHEEQVTEEAILVGADAFLEKRAIGEHLIPLVRETARPAQSG